jgi:hypothetical protein
MPGGLLALYQQQYLPGSCHTLGEITYGINAFGADLWQRPEAPLSIGKIPV